jgi:threonine dehydratase
VLHGDSYDDAYPRPPLATQGKLTFVHPYDDPDVIAGQGTIGMEILRQHQRPIDAIFVAVGGGGLIAGIAAYVKGLRPDIKVIGVEPVDADAMHAVAARRSAREARNRSGSSPTASR